MRIALFGGSFDPPHRGHLAIARAAADRFALDQVCFAPAARQPLKSDLVATFDQRLAMLTLACAEDLRFAVSTLDAPRPDGISPTTPSTPSPSCKAQHPQARLFNARRRRQLPRPRPLEGPRTPARTRRVDRRQPPRLPSRRPRRPHAHPGAARPHPSPRLHARGRLRHQSPRAPAHTATPASTCSLPPSPPTSTSTIYTQTRAVPSSLGPDPSSLEFHCPQLKRYQLLLAAAAACEDKKAEDIRILSLDPTESGLTDYFLICNGTNDRQNVAITDEIEIKPQAASSASTPTPSKAAARASGS